MIKPDFIFLAEPQIFLSDLSGCMAIFADEYNIELNSEDKNDVDIAMTRTRAKGGTAILWKRSLDCHVRALPSPSPAFLPIMYSPPGSPISIHIALYLPTSGREDDFFEHLSQLKACIDELSETYKDSLIYIRGDGNVNRNNTERYKIFSSFLSSSNLRYVPTNHTTYHHFLGEGSFDSDIDIILQPSNFSSSETVTSIHCNKVFADIDSHHDIIISKLVLPAAESTDPEIKKAPKVHNTRNKIIWSEEGIVRYQTEVANKLSELRKTWLNPLSKTSLSVLLYKTCQVLKTTAMATNKSIDLSVSRKPKVKRIPEEIRVSMTTLKAAHGDKVSATVHRNVSQLEAATKALQGAKKAHRSLVRKFRVREQTQLNRKLYYILKNNPTAAFNIIKKSKASCNSFQVPHIMVEGKKYGGDMVIDGFYASLLKLKSLDEIDLAANPDNDDLQADYLNIKYLCNNKTDLPPIALSKSSSILKRIKPAVSDFNSITAKHFINAGLAGFVHFNLVLNAFIIDVNNATVEELNSVYALLLYKGHKKDRTVDSSYRTISTCPLIAKGLDMYVRDLFISKWNSKQADTQYQGDGSSHELASLLITEAVQTSRYVLKQPIFLLFLDARSAFDNVVTPYLIRQLYMSGMEGNSLLYIDNRLTNRLSFLEFNKETVGPIHDECGLEQGGVYSSDLYKLYNNDQLDMPQQSRLGVDLGSNLVISAVGQADDTAALANDIHKLNHILGLVMQYCRKFNVKLSSNKTKLLMIPPPRQASFLPYNPINIYGEKINLVGQAEHVGVVRSVEGNMPNILLRVSAFKRALGSILSCGMARSSRSNPAASLKILSCYGTPVLMSGLGSLVLSAKEVAVVDQQYKKTLQNILKLPSTSPASLIYFTAGSLPGTAIVHLRQLSLFGMLCRLPEDPLNHHGQQVFLNTTKYQHSWFMQIRSLLKQYKLPHPIYFMTTALSKEAYKKLIKSKVIDFWEDKLRAEASFLPSLRLFLTPYFSLCHPHRIWTSAGHKPYEVSKARIQLLFLSNQYPCGARTRHWSQDNPQGLCSYPTCRALNMVETPEHMLLVCPAFNSTRERLLSICLKQRNPVSYNIITNYLFLHQSSKLLRILLDCSTAPEVILAAQTFGNSVYDDLFYIGRTWCFSIHREHLKMLGRWNIK